MVAFNAVSFYFCGLERCPNIDTSQLWVTLKLFLSRLTKKSCNNAENKQMRASFPVINLGRKCNGTNKEGNFA